jgi:hypothetical protein
MSETESETGGTEEQPAAGSTPDAPAGPEAQAFPDPPAAPPAAEPGASAPATAVLPSADDVKAWEGYQLDEISGQGVAKVEGLFVDAESGDPAWVLAKLGRFGKTVPVSIRECAAAAGRVWVPHEREVIRNAPAVDPSMPLNREQEIQVLEYYGIPESVGRGAEIADRAEGATTAKPPA